MTRPALPLGTAATDLDLIPDRGPDVLPACQGQLRLAPGGQVIGLDMESVMKIAAARGYNLVVLEPPAEAGPVEALDAGGGEPD